jgi:hypothetical protein
MPVWQKAIQRKDSPDDALVFDSYFRGKFAGDGKIAIIAEFARLIQESSKLGTSATGPDIRASDAENHDQKLPFRYVWSIPLCDFCGSGGH